MASIIKRSGRWRVVIRKIDPSTGKMVAKTKDGFATKAEAQAWANDRERAITKGVHDSVIAAERTTLSEALTRYLRDVTPLKKGAVQESRRIKAWLESDLAGMMLSSIRSVDLAGWRNSRLKAGASAGTIRLDLAVLSHLFTVAAKEWGMESLGNPVRILRLPSPGKARDRRLKDPQGSENESEEDRLIAACSTRAAWLGALVRLALATGMRQGELLALEWPYVDLKRKVAHLPDTKNGEARNVPLSSAAIAAIKDMAPDGDKLPAEGRVFPYRDDKVRREFPKACKAAGIVGLRFHDLRHEATSRLFEKGLNPMEAASVTGHKTLQMLKRYTHLRAEDLARRLG